MLVGLALLGVVVAIYGAMIGAGGGFLVVPFLLLTGLADAQQAAGTSLVMVAISLASGSVHYLRERRVDLRTAALLGAVSVPGSFAGAFLTRSLAGPLFEGSFGALLCVISAWLLLRPSGDSTAAAGATRWGMVRRELTDRSGTRYSYSYYLPGALLASAAIGVVSSTFGIGGGVILVPTLVRGLGFPPHVATATVHPVLALSAAIGAVSHLAMDHVLPGPALALSAGAVLGAQLGAQLSARLKGSSLVRMLSIALAIVGARLVLRALGV